MPLLTTVTAIVTLAGTFLGASEKGVSLFEKFWPTKPAQEEGILVELARQLPLTEREQAVTAMKSVYATLTSATEQVRRLQRQQLLVSLNRLGQRTLALLALAFGLDKILTLLHYVVTVPFAIAVTLLFLAIAIFNGWSAVNISISKTDLDLNKLVLQTSEKLPATLSNAFKIVRQTVEEPGELLTHSKPSVLGEEFLDSYDKLMARMQALQLYCLRLKFVQSNDALKSYLWASLEEAIVEAIARMVANGDLIPMPAEPFIDEWRENQREKIEFCLKDTGVADMFATPLHSFLWEEDLAAQLHGPNGKADLLGKMRRASRVPTFAQI